MIDTMLNLLFRCPHRRLTRPMAPITKAGKPHSQSYVVCLDCGKQFEYDLERMRMGRVVDHSHDAGVVPPMPRRAKQKVGYAIAAAVPAALVLRAIWRRKPAPASPGEPAAESAAPAPPEGAAAHPPTSE